jgi:tRNA/rRNA methyltransferase
LLTEAQRDRIDVVLVSPRNPLNIGAAARAMANFGFGRLAVVAPYAPHWREARSAVGAPEVLQNTKSTECLAAAVAGCTLVVGTGTLTYRKPEQRVVALPELSPLVGREMARGGRVAVVFGPEKHGLTREDLSLCHMLVEIPTDARQPSMNLGQAVAVCLYELARGSGAEAHDDSAGFMRGLKPPPPSVGVSPSDLDAAGHPSPASEMGASAASSGELERLAAVVEEAMRAADYSPAAMREANRHDLRVMLRRLGPSKRETRRILGLFRRILWQIQHRREDGAPKAGG